MANDRFEEYFTEKLWNLIPEYYRHEDGYGESQGVLRALVEVMARQAAVVRRGHDRLWDNQFIDLCDDWAVPYIGDLLATRMVSALNARGRRVDVAKTIYYRRRKGTPAVLEELISDITGWEGKVVEQFRRLARSRHRLDTPPAAVIGSNSGTMPGGWANLRSPRVVDLNSSPFDDLYYTTDVRRHRGGDGLYSINKLGFYLQRMQSYQVKGVTPYNVIEDIGFTFDPSGRNIPLFMPRSRFINSTVLPDGYSSIKSDWHEAREWELPAPMRCRVLGHAEYELDEALVIKLINQFNLNAAQQSRLRLLQGLRFASDERFRLRLDDLDFSTIPGFIDAAIKDAVTTDCGKSNLLGSEISNANGKIQRDDNAVSVEDAPGSLALRELTSAGALKTWSFRAAYKKLIIDPERGRLFFKSTAKPVPGFTVSYHYGFSGEIGAGPFYRADVEKEERQPNSIIEGGGSIATESIDKNGITQLNDCATYNLTGAALHLEDIENLTLQAANGQRPYLVVGDDWVLDSGVHQDSSLLLDGLWIGALEPKALIIEGDYEQVILRHVTLDPGGERSEKSVGDMVAPVFLVIRGNVEKLQIQHSLLGRILTDGDGAVEKLIIQDSILQTQDSSTATIELGAGAVVLERVTVLGDVIVHRLWATESIVAGQVLVTDTQRGCFRFSAASVGSRLPNQPYQHHLLDGASYIFTSRRFGNPAYCQLSEAAPEALHRGAEDGSEIGAFCSLKNPIKLESLQAKVHEFMPFGLIPQFIKMS